MSDTSTIPLALRPLAGRDLPQVAQIAQKTHQLPWTERDSQIILQPEGTLGWVAEAAHRLAGFVLCTVTRPREPAASRILPTLARFFRGLFEKREPRTLHAKLVDLCVAAEWPQSIVERALLEQLERDLRRMGDHIQIVVPESSLPAQLFLHQAGYQANQVLRGYYGCEDGYLLAWPQAGPTAHAKQRPFHAVESGVTGEAERHLGVGRGQDGGG
jgi:ribosomal protein S18 acetylase RimI-like enzyme